jgi:hypothetical protein
MGRKQNASGCLKENFRMLSNVTHVYEETIAPQPLTVLIGLSFTENHLLSELSDHAKTIAPHLGRALTARIQQLAGSYSTLPLSSTELQFYLQDWFLQIFQSRENAYLELSDTFPRINQIVLLTGIDVILTYGHEITQHGSDPEGSTNAFNKALALKIASEHLQTQVDFAEHLYDMMLLD